MDLDKGGRGAIERMVEAYGFTTRQALCEKLGISKSTLATRYMRDSFPSDWVIQCALETGASLRWITTGEGVIFENSRTDITELPKKKIIDGKLYEAGFYIFDKAFLSSSLIDPLVILDKNVTYIGDSNFSEIYDGNWLINIDGIISIKFITNVPGGNISVTNEGTSFTCSKSSIEFLAKITAKTIQL